MKPVKLAVVGAGHLGAIHARLANSFDEIELVGIFDATAEIGRDVARQLGTRAFVDFDALISQIDAAVVATPTHTHRAVSLELLQAGIHVLVEKPIAVHVADADRLISAARSVGRILQVGHVERFNPVWAAMYTQIERPKFIEAVRTSGYTFRSTDVGVVLDLMIHDLDLILSVVPSRLKQIEASGICVLGQHEDIAEARLLFENGCVARLTASRVSDEAERRMRLFCEEAFWSIDFAGAKARSVQPDQAVLQGQVDPSKLSDNQIRHLRKKGFSEMFPVRQIDPPSGNALGEQLRQFANSIRTGQIPRVSGQQGRDALAVAQQIVEEISTSRSSGHSDAATRTLNDPWYSPTADQQRKAG